MPNTTFDDTRLYSARDPEMRMLATEKTLANWRSAGRGPRWKKLGRQVRYLGADLNRWLLETMTEAA